jgi:hypothetical protein
MKGSAPARLLLSLELYKKFALENFKRLVLLIIGTVNLQLILKTSLNNALREYDVAV